MTSSTVPIVDVTNILNKKHLPVESLHQELDYVNASSEFCSALHDIGFAYIKNHGISEELINKIFQKSKQFYDLPEDKKFEFNKVIHGNGYVAMNREKLFLAETDGQAARELKESFDINTRSVHEIQKEAIYELPFVPDSAELLNEALDLCFNLLGAIECGLKLEPNTLIKDHHRCSGSMMRILHYPPVDKNVPPNSIRCGTHSDYGTITLLFQDNIGGLEVLNTNNEWLPANPVEGTILVNVGDLLHFWTSGFLVATKHRVVIPEDQIKKNCSRQSMTLFLQPADEVVMSPWPQFENSKAIEEFYKEKMQSNTKPFTSFDYLDSRYKTTYIDN